MFNKLSRKGLKMYLLGMLLPRQPLRRSAKSRGLNFAEAKSEPHLVGLPISISHLKYDRFVLLW